MPVKLFLTKLPILLRDCPRLGPGRQLGGGFSVVGVVGLLALCDALEAGDPPGTGGGGRVACNRTDPPESLDMSRSSSVGNQATEKCTVT